MATLANVGADVELGEAAGAVSAVEGEGDGDDARRSRPAASTRSRRTFSRPASELASVAPPSASASAAAAATATSGVASASAAAAAVAVAAAAAAAVAAAASATSGVASATATAIGAAVGTSMRSYATKTTLAPSMRSISEDVDDDTLWSLIVTLASPRA